MGMDFFVDENVLIPRPDTEPLVESVIEIAKGIDVERLLIMDIGTGSGAITISLAALIDNADLVSVDISKGAIEVAKRNAEHNNVSDKIKFVNSDLFEGLPVEAWGNKFDIIVSNPPYIPSEVIEGLQVEVSQFEPRLALDGGEDGYNYYRRISHEALKYLKKGGFLAFEVGHDQAVEIKKMLLAFGYGNIRFVKDLPGIDRVVIGELV